MFLVSAETRDTTTVISTHIDKIFVMMVIVEFILIVFCYCCIRVGEIILVMIIVRWWGGSDGFDGNDGW